MIDNPNTIQLAERCQQRLDGLGRGNKQWSNLDLAAIMAEHCWELTHQIVGNPHHGTFEENLDAIAWCCLRLCEGFELGEHKKPKVIERWEHRSALGSAVHYVIGVCGAVRRQLEDGGPGQQGRLEDNLASLAYFTEHVCKYAPALNLPSKDKK